MIDFNFTEEQNGIITFVNENVEAVKRYPLLDLEKYVKDNLLHLTYEHIENDKGETVEIEVYHSIPSWIDDNFDTVTKDFYLSNNPTEHVAKHNYAYSKEANS